MDNVISAPHCSSPCALALDLGTSSARAILFDSKGRRIEGAQSQVPYELDTTPDGGVEIDADRLIAIVVDNIGGFLDRLADLFGATDLPVISAVALSTFWHNLVGINDQGRAITPVYSWNDTRATDAARRLRSELDERAVHARTGCVLHPSYWPAKLVWLGSTQPELFKRVARWISIGDYLHLRLLGVARSSISMASATGLFNQNECDWDHELLGYLEINREQLLPLTGDGGLTGLGAEYASNWPGLARARWFAALGDGACGNVGSGCVTRDRAALMIGTSGALRVLFEADSVTILSGLWCYRADRRRFVMGGALSNGGNLYAWMNDTLRLGQEKEVESQLAAMAPDAHGLTVLPFLSGERSTGWAGDARAAISGLSLDTTPLEILRAGLESVAYRFAAIYDLLVREIGEPREIVASGAALLRSPVWAQIISDVIGKQMIASAETETSARGAALMALESMGAISSVEDVQTTEAGIFSPDARRHAQYQEARERQDRLYRALIA